MATAAAGATHQPVALVAGAARLDAVSKALEGAGRRVRRAGDVPFDFKLAALNDGETAATQVRVACQPLAHGGVAGEPR